MSDQNPAASGKVQKRKRVRPLPAHVNARNLATEKRKRCEMKENLLDLARLVPSLTNARRLNKVLIVNESIKHFRTQRDMCLDAAEDVQAIIEENQRLIAELNVLRSQVGGPLIEPKPITEAMTQLMSVKDEVYGEFNNGFGDNWAAEADDAQRSRSGTADQEHQLGLDGFFLSQLSPPDEVTLGNELRFAMPTEISGVIPGSLSEQAETAWNFMPTGEQAHPPPMASLDLDLFASASAPMDNNQLATIPETLNLDFSSSSWAPSMDMVNTQTYVLDGIGQADTTKLT
ncbi:hypothetical protein CCUS01_07154 [Colletotrichum cuscutae]|uniref:BHLH domain-containing protein n=1 Tax=Colletotrichum cuscutae TaxID=1209917 RepID=A0AAI9UZH3_9PEZI|nr:hypothetical protein CCUS01_07154 [Colletotrichum cuscutae]